MHKARRIFIIVLFFASAIMLITGLFMQESNLQLSQKLIGGSVLCGFFILMPIFIYHRWKNKDIKDYMLTKENIQKMQDFSNDKKI